MDNIVQVEKDGLCTGCGTCAGICPENAIEMQKINGLLLPKVEETECIHCRICVECCPGHSVDLAKLSKDIFGRVPEDALIGNFLGCYIGHSNDERIRLDSSSGGVVTHLLLFALQRGIINGAAVVHISEDDPLGSEASVVTVKEEIISASKSRYSPVASCRVLKEILSGKGKFAIVGLPCHIHGIRKAEKKIKNLQEKIVLHIGIMCSHTVNSQGIEHLIRKLGIALDRVVKIDFRGQGWPGSMVITLKDSSPVIIPYVGKWKAYWPIFSSFFFTPRRCLMCPDETNELADISVGDAWIPELKGETKGQSLVIVRTEEAMGILDSAISSGAISLRPIGCDKVRISQREPLMFKKSDIGVRLAMVASSGQKTPGFSPEFCASSSHSISSFARSLFVFLNVRISESKMLERLLIGVPFPILRLYYGVYKFLCSI